ncbi:hypothetical protein [Paenibacillus tepidiphilus]|uniref:hypothetical protein n=1 Tax=Paenibacillus tepidiphilus TaxID=2608683 RepID=UPI00123C202B|nr:hypothetical protein [Paenibacillus tepidiphilus]
MFDFIGNLKEFKNMTLFKLLFFSTYVLLILFFARKFMPHLFADFLETVSYFSRKLNYEKWEAVLPLIQILFGSFVVMVAVAFFIALILYGLYWRKQTNARLILMERETYGFQLNSLHIFF